MASSEWTHQVSASLVELYRRVERAERRVEQLEATVRRLDTHSGEMAGELLAVIDRTDAADAKIEGVSDSLVAHQERAGRHGG